ncbi:hypothetical protein Vretifemale_9286 [Volvox reticuliferus]|uniref:Secreted protein n=1 Tax=Volvox reticuliferus TaxID=1737510 RepID=A0A8J4FP29_9CHLO|nr:hypothetical protein Vretifemale_9286 [Volvox reticuliferus]
MYIYTFIYWLLLTTLAPEFKCQNDFWFRVRNGPYVVGCHCTAAALTLRTGVDLLPLSGAGVMGSPSATSASNRLDLTASLIFGGLLQNPGQWLRVMAASAISPASNKSITS